MPFPRRPLPLTLAVVLFVLVAGEFGNPRPPTDTVRFRANMNEAMDQLWNEMPRSAEEENVHLTNTPSIDCANEAMRKAHAALTEVGVREAARRAAVKTVELGASAIKNLFGAGWVGYVGDAVKMYLESSDVDQFADNFGKYVAGKAGGAAPGAAGAAAGAGGRAGKVLSSDEAKQAGSAFAKYLWGQLHPRASETLFESSYEDGDCGTISVAFELRAAPDGHRTMYFRASGNCQCKWPTNVPRPMQMGSFTVIGHGDLQAQDPVVSGDTITINYRLANLSYDVMASCGCPDGESSGGAALQPDDTGTGVVPQPDPRPVYERICAQRCGQLYEIWQETEREANRLAQAAGEAEQQVADLQRRLAEAQRALEQEQGTQRSMEEGLERSKAQRGDVRVNQERLENDIRATGWALDQQKGKTFAAQYRVNELTQQLQETQRRANYLRSAATRRATEAAQARDAYFRCAASCYEQARQAGEINELPQEIRDWQRSQPRETPQTSSADLGVGSEQMLVGVVVARDTRPGEKTTARVVPNPKSFQNIPGLQVIEVTTRVALGKDGKPDIDHLQARIGDGPPQACDGPVSGTVPSDGKPLRVTVGQPGQAPGTGEARVAAGQTRTAPQTVRPQEFHVPAVLQRGTVGVVHGPFDGRNLGTSVTIGGKRAEILAESGSALYFVVPGGVQPGQNQLVVEEQGTRISFRVAAVGLQMSAGRLQLEKGESTTYAATVTGADKLPASAWQAGDASEFSDLVNTEALQRSGFRPPAKGSPGFVLLVLENMSPQVVSMSGGNVIQQQLGASAFSGGPYTYNGSVHSHEKGTFSIKGTVIPFLAPVAGE